MGAEVVINTTLGGSILCSGWVLGVSAQPSTAPGAYEMV